MKRKIITTAVAVLVGIAFAGMVPSNLFAWDKIKASTCTVDKTIDSGDIDGSVRPAEIYFNKGGNKQGCRSEILFNIYGKPETTTDADDNKTATVETQNVAINLKYPLYLGGNASEGGFYFGPKDPEDFASSLKKDLGLAGAEVMEGVIQFNLLSQTKYPHPDYEKEINDLFGGKKCAIYINSSYVTISNVYLNLNGTVDYGICVNGTDVTLKNVVISKPKVDAVYGTKGAQRLTFGDGMIFMDPGVSAINSEIELTADQIGAGNGGEPNDWSFIISGGSAKAIQSDKSSAYVYVESVSPKGGTTSGKYQVVAKVVSCLPVSGGKCENGQVPTAIDTDRIQIHKIITTSVTDPSNIAGIEKSFIRYNTASEIKSGGITGVFQIIIDTATAESPELGVKSIYLIPELGANKIGSSSDVINMVITSNVAPDTDAEGWDTEGDAACLDGWSMRAVENIDSDKDGIKDIDEDINGNCYCDANESCFVNPDTDNDGLIDSLEDGDLNGYRTCWVATDKVTDLTACSETVTENCYKSTSQTKIHPIRGTNVQVYELVPAKHLDEKLQEEVWTLNDDGSPTNFDSTKGFCTETNNRKSGTDSDKDGISDGMEDRTAVALKGTAHYYEVKNGTISMYKNGAEACVLSAGNSRGVEFHKVEVTNEDGEKVKKGLQCRDDNIPLSSFNGQYDVVGTGETNPLNPDTDLDGLCDSGPNGTGTGVCVNMTGPVKSAVDDLTPEDKTLIPGDRCPSTWLPSNNCTAECHVGDIKMGVENAVASYNASHTDATTTVDEVMSKIKASLSSAEAMMENKAFIEALGLPDSDNDSIPDVIEQPDMTCNIGFYGYNAFAPSGDADADGKPDNVDKCPTDSTDNCKPNTSYGTAKLIACYIDTDNDGLYNCEEDDNMNGIVDGGELDPYNDDWDKDGLKDGFELKQMGNTHEGKTNPWLPDTDGDGRDDGVEVGADQMYQPSLSEDAGCFTGTYSNDTDPTVADTDDDGLNDGPELLIGTNPNNPDSDKDGIKDGAETNGMSDGKWVKYSSEGVLDGEAKDFDWSQTNPCSQDTDADGSKDNEEIKAGQSPVMSGSGCMVDAATSPYGVDTDCDGLPNKFEVEFGTDPENSDTDGDNLKDGCSNTNGKVTDEDEGELCWHVKNKKWDNNTINVEQGESNPGKMGDESCPNNGQSTISILSGYSMSGEGAGNYCSMNVGAIGVACGSDSDGDGLPDYYEKKFGTLPMVADTDGDGILDGLETGWVVSVETAPGSGIFKLKKGTTQVQWLEGSAFTNPNDPDTDGDGLCDGYCKPYDYEIKNCIGPQPQKNAEGFAINSDPTNADTDNDGIDDKSEGMSSNRGAGLDINAMLSPDSGGCAGSISGSGGETWGMTIMFGLMLIATRTVARVRKAKSAVL